MKTKELVLVVRFKVPVENATSELLAALTEGELENWRTLGSLGPDEVGFESVELEAGFVEDTDSLTAALGELLQDADD